MAVINKTFELATNGNCELINITEQISRIVRKSRLKDGLVNVFIPGTYVGIATIECESGILGEFPKAFKSLKKFYDNENIDSQLKASLFSPTITLPFCKSSLILDTWQQLILVDFGEGTRSHRITIQMVGE